MQDQFSHCERIYIMRGKDETDKKGIANLRCDAIKRLILTVPDMFRQP
jgi:hypothetical protein